jgi:hypothetical protein
MSMDLKRDEANVALSDGREGKVIAEIKVHSNDETFVRSSADEKIMKKIAVKWGGWRLRAMLRRWRGNEMRFSQRFWCWWWKINEGIWVLKRVLVIWWF